MVTVEKDVRLLVKKELATVNEDFPLFASAYEGWAKVRAALAGVETERYMLDRYVEQRLWNEARFGRDIPKEDLKEAQSQAVQMAAQAIRLAAMICKLEKKGGKIGMILKKEIIEKAVNWWVEKVTANQPHSNGDNGYTSIVTCLLADSRTKKISKKQTDVFKKALAREIEEEAKKRTRFSICCDYEPCKVLFVAAHEAGIPTANFPFKTMMFINEEDGVVVRDGYGAPPVKI